MGVYIKGMEMPQEGFVEVLIRDDGMVQQTGQSNRFNGMDYYTPYIGETPAIYKAVPVPTHGDLIERDKLRAKEFIHDGDAYAVIMSRDIEQASTIIPASGGSEDWITKAVTDFCREHNVTVIVKDEWKTRKKKVMLRKGNYAVIHRICYDALPTLLPSAFLNEMLQEIPAEEGE